MSIREYTSKDGTRSFVVRVGKKPQRTFSEREFGSRRGARAAAKKHEAELEAGGTAQPLVTAKKYAERFLSHLEQEKLKGGRKRKSSTLNTYTTSKNAFVEEFGGRYLHQITRGEARDWALGVSRGPVKFAIQMCNRAVEEGMLGSNPFRGLDPGTEGRSNENPPTLEEFAKLQDACSVLGDEYGPHFRALLTFAGFSGLRPGELFALEWDDIDFDTRTIHVNRRLYRGTLDLPKSNATRPAVLIPQARDAILPLEHVAPTVFVSKRGQRMSQSKLSLYWGQVKAKAGLDYDFYHATKHRFVHEAYVVKHLSPNAIAQQMGWSRESVDNLLRVYGHGSFGWQEEWQRAYGENVVEIDFAHGSHMNPAEGAS